MKHLPASVLAQEVAAPYKEHVGCAKKRKLIVSATSCSCHACSVRHLPEGHNQLGHEGRYAGLHGPRAHAEPWSEAALDSSGGIFRAGSVAEM